MNVSATQKLPPDDVRMILEIATAAPSVLNTQPWRFNVSDDEIDLLADQSRALPVADPNGRQLTLSCGAALFNLRLAVRSLGREPVVLLLPRAADPSLLATVRFAGPVGSDPGLDSLLPHVPKRRTNRGPFTDELVPPAVLSRSRQPPSSKKQCSTCSPGCKHGACRTSYGEAVSHFAVMSDSWTRCPGGYMTSPVGPTASPLGRSGRVRLIPARSSGTSPTGVGFRIASPRPSNRTRPWSC